MQRFKSIFSVILILFILLMNIGVYASPVLALEKEGSYFEQNKSDFLLRTREEMSKREDVLGDRGTGRQLQKLTGNVDKMQSIKSPERVAVEGESYVEGEVLVKYKKNRINLETFSGRVAADNFSRIKSMEKKEDLRRPNISVLKIKDNKTVEEKIAELKNDPNVEYVQPNFLYYPLAIDTNDTYRDKLWGLDNYGQEVGEVSGTPNADINILDAWAISEGDENDIIVAVIDSGVAYNHPDLADNMWDGSNCLDDEGNYLGGCNHGYDYEDDDKIPLPTSSSHGTHIAGTIAAVKNNNKGIVGVAPNVKIMAIKTNYTSAQIVNGINFAGNNGAKIINASWGCYGYDQDGDHAVCGVYDGTSYDYRDQAMIDTIESFSGLFVAAAGNGNGDGDYEGDDHDSGQTLNMYPCDHTADNIICVAATDQDDILVEWSDYGATSVDVGAPGVNVYSTVADSEVLNETFTSVTPPNIPNSWTKTGNWGTYDFGDDKVLYGDYFNIPYANNVNSTIVSPIANLSGTNVTGAMIDFYTKCDTEYFSPFAGYGDYMILEISDDGINFTELYRWNEWWLDDNLNSSDASPIQNIKEQIPELYLTSNFKIRFRWFTDSSNVPDINYDGCWVDNIKITKYTDGSDEQYAYGYMQGTSMATPHVAGLAGLIWGYKPELDYSEVKDVILNTGDDIPDLHPVTGTHPISTGKRINAFNALDSITPPVISNAQVATTTPTSTVISWDTDKPATSQVVYSTTTPVSSIIVYADTLVTNHIIELANLTASTTYYFYIESVDEYGNIATSTEQSFTTAPIPPTPDTTPPYSTVIDFDDLSVDQYGNNLTYYDGVIFSTEGIAFLAITNKNYDRGHGTEHSLPNKLSVFDSPSDLWIEFDYPVNSVGFWLSGAYKTRIIYAYDPDGNEVTNYTQLYPMGEPLSPDGSPWDYYYDRQEYYINLQGDNIAKVLIQAAGLDSFSIDVGDRVYLPQLVLDQCGDILGRRHLPAGGVEIEDHHLGAVVRDHLLHNGVAQVPIDRQRRRLAKA